jgi:hypothetical protein
MAIDGVAGKTDSDRAVLRMDGLAEQLDQPVFIIGCCDVVQRDGVFLSGGSLVGIEHAPIEIPRPFAGHQGRSDDQAPLPFFRCV